MALIVQKFGGTSVGSVERIRNVARRVAKWRAAGHDLVASTGEQVTVGLLAMALLELGLKARSYTGWQVKILTDSAFTRARIIEIQDAPIRQDLADGCVVIVAGFQG